MFWKNIRNFEYFTRPDPALWTVENGDDEEKEEEGGEGS
jgi:hypothetical protein